MIEHRINNISLPNLLNYYKLVLILFNNFNKVVTKIVEKYGFWIKNYLSSEE